jgi:hypothetical protein
MKDDLILQTRDKLSLFPNNLITHDLIDRENYFHVVTLSEKCLQACSYLTIEEGKEELKELNPECIILYQGYSFGEANTIFNITKPKKYE